MGIEYPEIALIKIKKNHVPLERYPEISHHLLDKECFGSLFLKNAKEVDQSLIPLFKESSFKEKIGNKDDFLKIALFDIWLANEDRNHNNFNLLLNPTTNNLNFFYVIDHVNIFNSSYLNYDIAIITEEDSIIKTDLAKFCLEIKRKRFKLWIT